MISRICVQLALVSALGFSGMAQAALHDRGGGLIYDDVLDVTWLQDANYADTQYANTGGAQGIAGGSSNWIQASNWAASLSYYDSIRNVTYTDWRLPGVGPVNGGSFNYGFSVNGSTDVGYGITSPNSELAYMFYVNLGNLGNISPLNVVTNCWWTSTDTCLDNTGPFQNVQHNAYWSNTESNPPYPGVWFFAMNDGHQEVQAQVNSNYAWAVRDGDVATVPEPETYAMMLAGVGLVGWAARRRTPASA